MPSSPATTRKEVFTTGDVARLCGLSTHSVVKAMDRGLIKGFLLPPDRKIRRFPRKAVEAFLREQAIPFTCDGEYVGEG
jgi:hypothetical protein